ncbi:hypothetical protein AZE42_13730 [Rhizopogon vesiculosus]|uniref:Ricin B lectin domain-containing protein n=1 Tax=Rhizopogon vesiculosus TaxID=180088 RepID=A0A1J8QI91_9AGAM|nr:hypothetical protein AZE42_13730 [Rhizopogon vesiculosus]
MACVQDRHTYTLTNCKGGTVLDLSGGDNHSSKHHLSDITITVVPTNW